MAATTPRCGWVDLPKHHKRCWFAHLLAPGYLNSEASSPLYPPSSKYAIPPLNLRLDSNLPGTCEIASLLSTTLVLTSKRVVTGSGISCYGKLTVPCLILISPAAQCSVLSASYSVGNYVIKPQRARRRPHLWTGLIKLPHWRPLI